MIQFPPRCFDSTSRYHGRAIIPQVVIFDVEFILAFRWVYLCFWRGAAQCTFQHLDFFAQASHSVSVTKPSA